VYKRQDYSDIFQAAQDVEFFSSMYRRAKRAFDRRFDSFPEQGGTSLLHTIDVRPFISVNTGPPLVPRFDTLNRWSQDMRRVIDVEGRIEIFLRNNPDMDRADARAPVTSAIVCSGRWARYATYKLHSLLFPGGEVTQFAAWTDPLNSEFQQTLRAKAVFHADQARLYRVGIANIRSLVSP